MHWKTVTTIFHKRTISLIVWLVSVLIAWQTIAWYLAAIRQDPMAEKKLPMLGSIALSWHDNASELFTQAGKTMSYAMGGFAIGLAVGVLFAILLQLSRRLEQMTMPYLLASQMIPIIGLAPIIMGLCRSVEASRLIIAAYITFFPVAMIMLSGMRSVSLEQRELFMAMATNRRQLFQKLLLPAAVPHFFTGAKVSVVMSVTAAVLVDTLSSQNGIGYIIVTALYGGGTKGAFWPALMLTMVIGLGSFAIIATIERLVLDRWGGRHE